MIFEFTRAELDFKVIIDEPGLKDYIQVDRHTGALLVQKVDWVHISKEQQIIKVDVNSYATDQQGGYIKGSGSRDGSFNAIEQENFDYFYLPSRNGEQLSKMIINGLLIANYGFMIFDPQSGEYYPPIWATVDIDETGQQIEAEEGTIYQKTGGNLTVTVINGPEGEYTYQIDDNEAQTSNVFEDVAIGSHVLKVYNSLSQIAFTQIVTV